jgi:hypothetical protein
MAWAVVRFAANAGRSAPAPVAGQCHHRPVCRSCCASGEGDVAQTASIAKAAVVVNPPPVIITNTLTGTFPFTAGLSNAFFSVSGSANGTFLTIANFSPIPSNGLTISMQFVTTNQSGYFKAGEH